MTLNSSEQIGVQEATMQRQRDPFSMLARMDREFDELVRRGWGGGRPAGGAAVAGFTPAVEIVRDGEDVVVRVELPGVDVERDVAIEVERGKLVISGERHDASATTSDDGQGDDSAESTRRVLVRELRYGQFRREFALPAGILPEHVSASYDSGLLDVRVRGVVQPEPRPVRVPITTQPGEPTPRVLQHEPAQSAGTADGQG